MLWPTSVGDAMLNQKRIWYGMTRFQRVGLKGRAAVQHLLAWSASKSGYLVILPVGPIT